jgi:hypothetical protein
MTGPKERRFVAGLSRYTTERQINALFAAVAHPWIE